MSPASSPPRGAVSVFGDLVLLVAAGVLSVGAFLMIEEPTLDRPAPPLGERVPSYLGGGLLGALTIGCVLAVLQRSRSTGRGVTARLGAIAVVVVAVLAAPMALLAVGYGLVLWGLGVVAVCVVAVTVSYRVLRGPAHRRLSVAQSPRSGSE